MKLHHRLIRIPEEWDNWLQTVAHASRIRDINSRASVSSEILNLIRKAYEAAQKPK